MSGSTGPNTSAARFAQRACGALALLLILCGVARAEIYSCRSPDGTRVFSDQRCGPDAKIVTGVTSSKKSAASKGQVDRPPVVTASSADLDSLLVKCDAGDTTACNAWTRNGGPNRLREKERQTQAACEAGSLTACEERYCLDGASDQCRSRVMKAAKLSGDTWYLRGQNKVISDGATRYDIRCIWDGARKTRDVTVTCAAAAGALRCSAPSHTRAFDQLEAAAASSCASP
jgi:hypothetical protein